MMRHRLYAVAVLLPVTIASLGCRAHPASLAKMVLSDAVDDADVKKRQSELIGHSPAAADGAFGERIDTLSNTRRPGREMLLYPVKLDIGGSSRYVVEVADGRITAISKGKRNIDGVEDVVERAVLEKKLIGKNRDACEADGELGTAVAVFRSQKRGSLVCVYDVTNFTDLRGARYCVLWFDGNRQCAEIRLVGISASTKDEPLR